MDQINYPQSINWFSAVVLTLAVGVVITTIGAWIEKKINGVKAIGIIFTTILLLIGISWIWYNFIGIIYFKQAVDTENKKGCSFAVATYEKAVKWNPKLTSARENLIRCKSGVGQSIGDLLPLFLDYDEILAYDPTYWRELAMIYLNVPDYPKMDASMQRSAILEPTEIGWITQLGEQFHRDRQYLQAEQVLRIVRNQDGGDNQALFWFAWALYEQGNYQDAINHFDICIERNYIPGRCHARKGFSLLAVGHKIDAKTEFELALQLDPLQNDVQTALQNIP